MEPDAQDHPLSHSAPGRTAALVELLRAVLMAIILALFARTWLLQGYRVPSDSMAPSLVAGDHLFVNKFIFRGAGIALPHRDVSRNDLVLFRAERFPDRILVKRCVALGGDRVEMRDKQLIVNDQPVTEGWVSHHDKRTYSRSPFAPRDLRYRDNFGPIRVPEDHLFCLGDNRDESLDSRMIGSIGRAGVIGRPMLVYWSAPPADPGVGSRSRFGRWLDAVRAFARPRTDRILLVVR